MVTPEGSCVVFPKRRSVGPFRGCAMVLTTTSSMSLLERHAVELGMHDKDYLDSVETDGITR